MPLIPSNICKTCVLPDNFPGITFDEHGICNHCRREISSENKNTQTRDEYRNRLDGLIGKIAGTAPTYDVIMAYSGGKDSSYTLKLLKEKYNLRILAFSFDNHFFSSFAKQNIAAVVNKLNIDHINYSLPWPAMKSIFFTATQNEIFPKAALLRASSICTACITLVKNLVLKTALEMSIPLIAFGWSPGQAPIQSALMKTNPSLIFANQRLLKDIFEKNFGKETHAYFLPDSYYSLFADRFPYNIHPLAFFDYNEKKINIDLQTLGWTQPDDTDTNSTNCLLNAFANHCHIERYGFHPYVMEIANMVRMQVMTRNEGIKKIYTEQNSKMVAYGKARLES